jgi:hypothetical protein
MELTDDNRFYDAYTMAEVDQPLIDIMKKLEDNITGNGTLFSPRMKEHFKKKYKLFDDNWTTLFLSFDAQNRRMIGGRNAERLREFLALFSHSNSWEIYELLNAINDFYCPETCEDVLYRFYQGDDKEKAVLLKLANDIRHQVNVQFSFNK